MARIVFMGTPGFAVPSLEALLKAGHTIAAVYTQPDRPAGRGRKIQQSLVKQAALAHGLPVFQPPSLRPAEEVDRLRDLAPDLIVVAAFGQLLRPNVIDFPPHGVLNVHASLLPRWRGASPVSAAILAGDAETGVTIMRIDPGLDTGPMIAKAAIPIDPKATTASLTMDLAWLGAGLLVRTIPGWLDGTLTAEPQDDAIATHAPRLAMADGEIDWSRPAAYIDRQVRACHPWPSAWTTWNGKILKVITVTPAEGEAAPGEVIAVGKSGLAIGTGAGLLLPERLQIEGAKSLEVAAFRAGQQGIIGATLGARPRPA